MMIGRNMAGYGSRMSLLLCVLLLLSSNHFTSAGLLNWRQDDGQGGEPSAATTTPISSVPVSTGTAASSAGSVAGSASASASASATATGSSATDASATGTATGTAASITASDGTAATANITSSAAAATTSSEPLDDTNDPHPCHIKPFKEGSPGNPFCDPDEGQTVFGGRELLVTWDSSLFPANTTNTISLSYLNDTGPSTSDTLSTLNETTIPNAIGATHMTIQGAWLHGNTTANLSLSLRNNGSADRFPSLMVILTGNATSSNHTTGKSKSQQLGEKVGIPIGLVFLIAAVALIAAFLCMRKRRGLGYGGGKAARSQRMNAAAAPVAGPTRGHHRRGSSFHDEPTRGVELQDRNGGGDSWDWGSPVSSPTTAGGRNSNAFREEMQRQKSGRRRS